MKKEDRTVKDHIELENSIRKQLNICVCESGCIWNRRVQRDSCHRSAGGSLRWVRLPRVMYRMSKRARVKEQRTKDIKTLGRKYILRPSIDKRDLQCNKEVKENKESMASQKLRRRESLDRVTNSVEWSWRTLMMTSKVLLLSIFMEVTSELPLPKTMDLAITQF